MTLLPLLFALSTLCADPLESFARIVFAPDGRTVAVSDPTGLTLVDPTGTMKPIRLAGRKGGVEEALMVFSGDSQRVAASWGSDVVVWDIPSKKKIGTVHTASSIEMSLSRNGDRIAWCPRWDASSGREGTVTLNDVGTGKVIREEKLRAYDAKFPPDGKSLAIACRDGSVRLLEPDSLTEQSRLVGSASCFLSLDFSPSGQTLLAGGALLEGEGKSGSSVANIWDLASGKIVWTSAPEPLRQIFMVQFVGESAVSLVSMILFFMGDGMDPAMRETQSSITGGKPPSMSGVRYSKDGRYAANLASKGHTLVIHELASGKSRKIPFKGCSPAPIEGLEHIESVPSRNSVQAPAVPPPMLAFLAVGLALAQGYPQAIKALEPAQKPKLLIVGFYHFANPGRDLAKAELDDHLSAKRQTEIASLNAKLAEFKPTHVAVEAPVGEPLTQQRYESWLAGTHTLTVDETQQVGFRVAKAANLKTISPIDSKLDMDFGKFMQTATPAAVGEIQRAVGEIQKMMGAFKDQPVGENLRLLNSPDADRISNGLYLRMLLTAKPGDYAGAELATTWWKRNFLWITNLSTVAQKPTDRVLVICGAGHASLLRSILKDSLDFELVPIKPFLQ